MGMRVGAINTLAGVDQWLGVLSGNLTGSNVNGFRGQQVEFKDVLSQEIAAGSPTLANGGSSIPAEQVSDSGATLDAVKTDFSQGSLQTTNQPTDLGITGDGFFVLSKVRNPKDLGDLVFTRNGSFHFSFFQQATNSSSNLNNVPGGSANASKGEYRLVNQDGLFVMGFQSSNPGAFTSGTSANLPGTPSFPNEGAFDDSSPLAAHGQFGNGFNFQPITVPFQTDPTPATGAQTDLNSNFTPKFDTRGFLTNSALNNDAPLATTTAAGQQPVHEVSFVALAKFSDNQGLSKDDGSTNFDWNPIAGKIFLGVPGNPNDANGNPNNVGASNTLSPGTLEASNASVNTTLPELTIAQKAFSADVKIVQVGNELIDDVNNLVK